MITGVCRKGIVGIAILVMIILVTLITVFIFSYTAMSRVKFYHERNTGLEEFKYNVLKGIEGYCIVDSETGKISLKVKTDYELRIKFYIFIYKHAEVIEVKLLECMSNCYLTIGVNEISLDIPFGISDEDIIGLKLISEEGIVVPIPRVV